MVLRNQSILSRRQALSLGGGAIASTALLSACTGGSGNGSDGAGRPQHGGEFVTSQVSDITQTFDLHAANGLTVYLLVSALCSKLVELKTGPDESGSQELVPDLATSWEVAEDGLSYTFHLRDNVTWHDIEPVNGRPFTSDDVVATFESIITRQARQSWIFERVANIQAPDDHTVVINMSRVYGPFLNYLAHTWNMIMPREYTEGRFDVENRVIGTGPFMFGSHHRGEQFIRNRNPNYYEPGRPYLDQLNTVFIRDLNTGIGALQSGRIDSTMVPNEDADRLAARDDVQLHQNPWYAVALYLNTKRPPFDDLRVRRAVALAIDWEGLGATMYGENWRLSAALPPSTGSYALTPEQIAELRPFDPRQAKALLAEAGYRDGFDTTMLSQDLSQHDVVGAEYMIQDLHEVGINVSLEVADFATTVERMVNGQYNMAKALKAAEFPDVFLGDFLPGTRTNYARIDDPRLTEMIEVSRETVDEAARIEQAHEIARYVETDVAAAIYGVAFWQPTAIHATVHNYHPHQLTTGKFWSEVWKQQ